MTERTNDEQTFKREREREKLVGRLTPDDSRVRPDGNRLLRTGERASERRVRRRKMSSAFAYFPPFFLRCLGVSSAALLLLLRAIGFMLEF